MLRLAVIGYGGIGAYHCNKIKELVSDKIEIAGFYDIDENRVKAGISDGYRAFENSEEVAKDKSVDAVLLSVPNDLHLPYTLQFAAAKKHILCEKPAAPYLSGFKKMRRAAEENGVKLIVHQNRRWDGDYLTVRNIDDSGDIGKIYRIESRVMGSNALPGDWRKTKAAGGGMILDWGVHLIDQALDMIKSDITSVYCTTSFIFGFEVDDGFKMELKFADGREFFAEVDTNCFCPLPRWLVFGDSGTAVIENWDISGRMVKGAGGDGKPLKGIKAGNGFTKTMAERDSSRAQIFDLPKADSDGRTFYENFYSAVKENAEPIVKNDQVERVLRVLETAFLSAKNNKIIKTKI